MAGRIRAVWCPERRLNIAVPYCRFVPFLSCGRLFLGIPYVFTTLKSFNCRGLLARINMFFDSYQSVAQVFCVTMGYSEWFDRRTTSSEMRAIKTVVSRIHGLATVLPTVHLCLDVG